MRSYWTHQDIEEISELICFWREYSNVTKNKNRVERKKYSIYRPPFQYLQTWSRMLRFKSWSSIPQTFSVHRPVCGASQRRAGPRPSRPQSQVGPTTRRGDRGAPVVSRRGCSWTNRTRVLELRLCLSRMRRECVGLDRRLVWPEASKQPDLANNSVVVTTALGPSRAFRVL